MPHQPDTADLARRDAIARIIFEAFTGNMTAWALVSHITQNDTVLNAFKAADTILAQAVLEKDAEIERLREVIEPLIHGVEAYLNSGDETSKAIKRALWLPAITQARTALKDKTNG